MERRQVTYRTSKRQKRCQSVIGFLVLAWAAASSNAQGSGQTGSKTMDASGMVPGHFIQDLVSFVGRPGGRRDGRAGRVALVAAAQ
jgi:hypothetical protein